MLLQNLIKFTSDLEMFEKKRNHDKAILTPENIDSMEVKQSVGICGPFEFYSGNQTAKAGQRLGCFLSFGSSVPPDSQLVR